MKKLIIAVALLVVGAAAHGQKPNVKIDNAGNYIALSRSAAKDTATGRFYIGNDDVLWPVYRTPRGKLYALRVSAKTGKTYKYYLKPDTDTLDWEGN